MEILNGFLCMAGRATVLGENGGKELYKEHAKLHEYSTYAQTSLREEILTRVLHIL